MPRTYPPRRPHIGFRLDQDVLEAVDKLAEARGVDRSEVLRTLLREGVERALVADSSRIAP